MFKRTQPLRSVVALIAVALSLIVFHISSIAPLEAVEDSCGVTLGEWQETTAAPAMHIEGATAVVDGKLFIISGFSDNSLNPSNRVDVYNPTTDVWETVANPRRETPFGTSHIMAAVDGTSVWIAGGFKGAHPAPPTKEVWKYDTVEDLWYEGPELPELRSGGLFTRVGRKLHYAGGTYWDRASNFSDHWTLNLDNPAEGWQVAPPLPEGRIHVSAAEVNGILYAIGGQFGHDHNPIDLKFLHAFNPATNTWERKADLPLARSHFEPGTTVIGGNIVIVGGRQNQDDAGQTDDVTLYDPLSDSWHELRPLPKPLIAPVAAYIGDKLIVTNGGYAWNLGSRETFVSQVSVIPCSPQTTATPVTPTPTAEPTEIPAGALAIIAPKTGEGVNSSDYVFQWTHIPGVTTYKLIIRSQDKTFKFKQNFTDAVCTNGICSTSLANSGTRLPNNKTLRVRVTAPTTLGKPKASWVNFTTQIPGKAVLVYPSNGGSMDTGLPQLVWKNVANAESYRVIVRNHTTGEKLLKQTLIRADTVSCDADVCLVDLNTLNISLRMGLVYRWNIVSSSADGKTKSDRWTFTVRAAKSVSEAKEIVPLPQP